MTPHKIDNYMEGKYDEMIKLMLVGDSSVGKTSIIRTFCHPDAPPPLKMTSTIGLDYSERILNIKGRNVMVQLWDTAGQERFQTLTPSYYRSAMGIFLVFSVTDKSSFNSVQLWIRQIKQYSTEDIPLIILCNKIDIMAREVSDVQCKALEKRHGVKTINTSVVNNHNITDAVIAIHQRIAEEIKIKPRPTGSVHLIESRGSVPENRCKC